MSKIDRTNIADHLLKYQFNLINKTLSEAELNEDWIDEWSISQEKFEEFKKYAVPLIKKVFKCNKTRALSTFDWFNMSFGLKETE